MIPVCLLTPQNTMSRSNINEATSQELSHDLYLRGQEEPKNLKHHLPGSTVVGAEMSSKDPIIEHKVSEAQCDWTTTK